MYSEDFERPHGQERNAEDVYSKPVRAGKRTYFFDVKTTKGNNDYYLTITESKRRQVEGEEVPSFEKHKVFLYKEDFAHFTEGLQDVIAYVQSQLGDIEERQEWKPEETAESQEEPKKKGLLGFLRK